MLCSGQEDEDEIWHRNSTLGRFSWLCSHWCLGPNKIASLEGHRYFVYFVDDLSRHYWVYLM